MPSNLESVIKKMNSKFKTGEIKVGVEFSDIDKIPFKSVRLNYMTYGGIPVGRLCEFSGSDGSGKTTTALDIVASAQKKFADKRVVFCDIESTFDSLWATKMGVDIDSLILYRPDSQDAEEVFQTLLDLMDTGEISLIVLDSIGAMVSGQQNEKDLGERTYGGISQSLTLFSKKAISVCARNNCTLIAINQIRDDMNSMYGGTTTTGGRAWRHNCSTRLAFRKSNYVDEKGNKLSRSCENPVGNIVAVDLVKSKVCPPDRKVGEYTINYLKGIDFSADLVDVCIKVGIVNQAGAWYSMLDTNTGELMTWDGTDLKFQGKSKLIEFLETHNDFYDYISNLISDKIK